MTPHSIAIAVTAAFWVSASVHSAVDASTVSFHVGNSLTVDSRPEALSYWNPGHSRNWHVRFGMPTSYHVANPYDLSRGESWMEGLARPTDQLVIQPFTDRRSDLNTEVQAVVDLIEYAQVENPAIEVYLFWAWPWFSEGDNHPAGWEGFWNNPYTDAPDSGVVMTRGFFDALHRRVSAETDATVHPIPVGEVLAMVSQDIDADRFYSDHVHFGELGEYIAATTLAASMFGLYDLWPTPDLFNGLDEEDILIIQDAVETVVPQVMWSFGESDYDEDQDTDIADILALQRHDPSPEDPFQDFDHDRDGDIADLLFQQRVRPILLDFDADLDGDIDTADLLVQQRNASPVAAVIAAPEPSAVSLIGVGCLLFLRRVQWVRNQPQVLCPK